LVATAEFLGGLPFLAILLSLPSQLLLTLFEQFLLLTQLQHYRLQLLLISVIFSGQLSHPVLQLLVLTTNNHTLLIQTSLFLLQPLNLTLQLPHIFAPRDGLAATTQFLAVQHTLQLLQLLVDFPLALLLLLQMLDEGQNALIFHLLPQNILI
jgi:hypothetical protein